MKRRAPAKTELRNTQREAETDDHAEGEKRRQTADTALLILGES